MSAADPVAALRAFALTQANIVNLTPSGIHAGELIEDETPAMPRGALVLKSSGGVSLQADSHVEIDTRRIDAFAFGKTPYEAERLMDEFALAMKRLRIGIYGGVLVYWVKAAGGSASGREPGVEWPRAFKSFQIQYAMEVVE